MDGTAHFKLQLHDLEGVPTSCGSRAQIVPAGRWTSTLGSAPHGEN